MKVEEDGQAPVSLWDLPVRLVHWSFVILLAALWWSWKSHDMALHQQLGLVMLGLVAFRLLWGLFGSSTARFAGFVRGPGAVLAYIRGLLSKEAEPVVGHNPIGGWSVVVLLGLLAAEVVLGLFAQDVDGLESGQLSYLVSYDGAEFAREWHEIGFNLLLAVVAVHIAAILFYLVVKRDNLVGPMVTGRKRFASKVSAPLIAPAWRILLCAAAAAALTWWVSKGCPLP